MNKAVAKSLASSAALAQEVFIEAMRGDCTEAEVKAAIDTLMLKPGENLLVPVLARYGQMVTTVGAACDNVTIVEPNINRFHKLRSELKPKAILWAGNCFAVQGLDCVFGNFESFTPSPGYSAVLLLATKDLISRTQYVQRAYDWLSPGGRLVVFGTETTALVKGLPKPITIINKPESKNAKG